MSVWVTVLLLCTSYHLCLLLLIPNKQSQLLVFPGYLFRELAHALSKIVRCAAVTPLPFTQQSIRWRDYLCCQFKGTATMPRPIHFHTSDIQVRKCGAKCSPTQYNGTCNTTFQFSWIIIKFLQGRLVVCSDMPIR